jgi:hypothetical protein
MNIKIYFAPPHFPFSHIYAVAIQTLIEMPQGMLHNTKAGVSFSLF